MTDHKTSAAKLELTGAMLIFGTIGIFVNYIPLASGVIALVRALLGSAFLICVMAVRRVAVPWKAVRRCAPLLCLSGACIGFNWILLFEAYRHTSVQVATLCYYMAPVFITLLSPIVLHERLTAAKLICIAAALAGMGLISGADISGNVGFTGILLGLGAAVLYACVVLMNKKLHGLGPFDTTVVQLLSAAAVLLPYTLLTGDLSVIHITPIAAVLLVVVGIVHTGAAYTLYFASMRFITAQTSAIFSYIDPATAIILSALMLDEKMTPLSFAGAALILASTLASELWAQKKQ